MQSNNSIAALDRSFEQILDEFPQQRRTLHERVGKAIQRELQSQITASGVNDPHGKVRRWQVLHVGSKGGYAAIRPDDSDSGAITGFLEQGHKIASPRGGKGYRPRIKVAYVNGYHFYSATSQRAESIAIAEAEDWADSLARKLEGSL